MKAARRGREGEPAEVVAKTIHPNRVPVLHCVHRVVTLFDELQQELGSKLASFQGMVNALALSAQKHYKCVRLRADGGEGG